MSHGGRTVRKLMLFVGVPLPGSGAWTGALVAAVLGMPVRQGVQALCVGGVVAAGIVTAVCSMGWIGGVITGVVAIGVMMVRIVRGSREMKSGEKKKDNTMMIKKETMEAEKKEDGELVQVVKNEDCGQWEQNKKHGGDGASSSGKSSSSSNRNSKRSTVSAVLLTWLGMVDVN